MFLRKIIFFTMVGLCLSPTRDVLSGQLKESVEACSNATRRLSHLLDGMQDIADEEEDIKKAQKTNHSIFEFTKNDGLKAVIRSSRGIGTNWETFDLGLFEYDAQPPALWNDLIQMSLLANGETDAAHEAYQSLKQNLNQNPDIDRPYLKQELENFIKMTDDLINGTGSSEKILSALKRIKNILLFKKSPNFDPILLCDTRLAPEFERYDSKFRQLNPDNLVNKSESYLYWILGMQGFEKLFGKCFCALYGLFDLDLPYHSMDQLGRELDSRVAELHWVKDLFHMPDALFDRMFKNQLNRAKELLDLLEQAKRLSEPKPETIREDREVSNGSGRRLPVEEKEIDKPTIIPQEPKLVQVVPEIVNEVIVKLAESGNLSNSDKSETNNRIWSNNNNQPPNNNNDSPRKNNNSDKKSTPTKNIPPSLTRSNLSHETDCKVLGFLPKTCQDQLVTRAKAIILPPLEYTKITPRLTEFSSAGFAVCPVAFPYLEDAKVVRQEYTRRSSSGLKPVNLKSLSLAMFILRALLLV